MKATVDAQGGMTISGENELENYALTKWVEDWRDKRVTLTIKVDDPTTPGVTRYQQVNSSGS